ncbi:uncharacterized protein [Drosophila tropicalis]|uniref:uncharacterized protein n=1 Tax=Drosophila tropicalis TaxID=46794 RepID=UPI0035AB7B75
MTHELITTQQLLQHRRADEQIEKTHNRWKKYFSWYPIEQAEHYKRYGEIYKETLAKYGEKKFNYYAKRIRLRKCYMAGGISKKQEDEDMDKQLKDTMGHLENYKPSVTTNGEYGLFKPNRLFECFELQK